MIVVPSYLHQAESHESFGSNGRHKCRWNERSYDVGETDDELHEGEEKILLTEEENGGKGKGIKTLFWTMYRRTHLLDTNG